MAEESQEKKKSGPIKRIFKWIGLGLLALLLIAGIVFQAPWKVITLLAIILAACTVLPKPARKWFWLAIGVVVIALIVWIFLPEADEGWHPYTFDEELAELEAKYAVPDEENAAMIYNELFDILDVDSNQPEFFIKLKPSSKDEPWLSKDHPETAEWLRGHQNTIEKLLQTANKDKCRFLPISADPFIYDKHMEKFPQMRRCAFLLLSDANNDIADGRLDAGLEKYLSLIQMADHLYQQPVMIDFLVSFAIERLALEQLNRFVVESAPTTEQLQFISNSIKRLENNWSSDWQKILDFEKLYAKNTHCSLAYEVNPKGKVRVNRDINTAFRIAYPQQRVPKITYLQRKLYKVKTIHSWFFMPSTPQKVSEIIDASFEKYYSMAEPEFDWTKQPKKPHSLLTKINFCRTMFNYKYLAQAIADISEESYYRAHYIYFRVLSLRRGLRLLAAIKQYHIEHDSWPDSLDAIKSNVPAEAFIDPVTRNQYVYENHGEHFSLYGETINIWSK